MLTERYKVENFIPVLEGCRGLAILLVMCYHFGPLLQWGWIGVDLFFVLSGFLITKTILSYPLCLSNILLFYRNRILRIVPAYFFLLLLFFIVLPVLSPVENNLSFRQLQEHQWYYWLFMADYWYAVNGWPAMVYLVPIWSLSVEFKFYLIWPLLLYLIKKYTPGQQAVVFLIVALCSLLFRLIGDNLDSLHSNFRYVLFLSRFDSFAIGGLLFLAIHYQLINLRASFWIVPFILLSLLLLTLHLVNTVNGSFSNPIISTFGYTIIAIGWASLIGSLLYQHSSILSFFLSDTMRKIGRYSYAIYLIHYPVWLLVVKINWPPVLQVIFATICTLILGRASYYLLEKPFMNKKKHPLHG